MSKESIVDINGHKYRYQYVDGETKYIGPVGEAPALSEEEFLKAIEGKPRWFFDPFGRKTSINEKQYKTLVKRFKWKDERGKDIPKSLLLNKDFSPPGDKVFVAYHNGFPTNVAVYNSDGRPGEPVDWSVVSMFPLDKEGLGEHKSDFLYFMTPDSVVEIFEKNVGSADQVVIPIGVLPQADKRFNTVKIKTFGEEFQIF